MLDRALAKTFANLSTLMLVALVFAGPIHLVHAFVYRNALAVQEIRPEIQAFPEGRQVRGVSKGDLDQECNVLLLALGLELLLLPLVIRAARRVIEIDDEGGVPTVRSAWGGVKATGTGRFRVGPVTVAAAIGAACAYLIWSITDQIADMASADVAWAVFGLGRALAVGMFIALTAGTAGASTSRERAAAPVESLDLY